MCSFLWSYCCLLRLSIKCICLILSLVHPSVFALSIGPIFLWTQGSSFLLVSFEALSSINSTFLFLITSRSVLASPSNVIHSSGADEKRWNTFGFGWRKTAEDTGEMWIIFLVNVTRFLFYCSLVHIFTWIYFEVVLCSDERSEREKSFLLPSAELSVIWLVLFYSSTKRNCSRYP